MAIATTLLEPQADRFVLFLHGILGTRANWRSIARRATEVWSSRGPRVGAILVDLRMHGESQDFEPPHTVSAAAEDLHALSDELRGRPIVGVVGHSFGGKVAMTYAAQASAALERLWVIDSAPGITPPGQVAGNTREVLQVLREVPTVWERREDFVAAVMVRGLARGIAQWLAMNLTAGEAEASSSTEGGPAADLRWPLDLDAIEALLTDYGEVDTVARPRGSADPSETDRRDHRRRFRRVGTQRPRPVRAITGPSSCGRRSATLGARRCAGSRS